MKRFLQFVGRYAMGVAGCLVVLIGSWVSARHRETLHEVLFRLGWRRRPAVASAAPPLSIPEIAAVELLGKEIAVRIAEPDNADGNVSGYEILVIAALAVRYGRDACFEIGTFDGRTALNIAANTPSACRVFTLDLPSAGLGRTDLKIAAGDEQFINKPASGARFRDTAYAARITQLLGDSATFDYSPYEGRMDLVFVDGSHSYEYVKADTEVAIRLLKPGRGVILWHDYGSPYWKDLTRALNEVHQSRPEFATMRRVRGTVLVVWRRGE